MPAFTHHIFVCGNVREPGHKRGCCDPDGQQALRDAFKRELKTAGFGPLARANHAGCLEQCEHGPTVVIYPQGIWYGRVRLEDVPRIVEPDDPRGRDPQRPADRRRLPEQSRLPASPQAVGRRSQDVLELVESVADVRHCGGPRPRPAAWSSGLVPTMGALHDGHVRLIERCRAEAGWVVVSIFVNPTQFGPERGLHPLSPDPRGRPGPMPGRRVPTLIFAPTPATVYPSGPRSTFVEVPGLSDVLEGASRPGHFRGVATVVLKLFEIVRPDLAVFGQKDYQQQLVIRRMVADLHVPVRIVTEPTVREPDGLAMSSRNRYLNPDERRAATVLHAALDASPGGRAGGESDRPTGFDRSCGKP